MSYLAMCPGRQVTVSDNPFYDGDVAVEVFDEGNHVPTCAIVLTSADAIVLAENLVAKSRLPLMVPSSQGIGRHQKMR